MEDRDLADLADAATNILGTTPEFIVRAPGRVNLIGEHTDYNGLPVMPMAIDRNIRIAGRRRDDGTVRLHNIGSFAERTFTIEERIPPFRQGDWGNYAKAAAHGLRARLGPRFGGGADLVITGDIPEGAGLSSSSALVVASALALLAANDLDLPYPELATLLPKAEQYVGTLSGGMDQTISLLGQAGHALRIDFAPLRYHPVRVPPNVTFVVCHSLVRADKAGKAKRAYNTRVIECRLAARIAAATLAPGSEPANTLGELTRLPAHPTADTILAAIRDRLPSDTPVSLATIATVLDTTTDELRNACSIPNDIGDELTIVARTRHILSEAERVDDSEIALTEGDTDRFAECMQASHASCRDDYDISCPALEELVATAGDAGALAARLTGAGFGGCIVCLVAKDDIGSVLRRIDDRFYARHGISPEDRQRYRFALEPSAGAEVHVL